MLERLISSIVNVVSGLGYPGIVILMFLESSFFPFPSEIVMIPAGYLSATGKMNLLVVIVCGILGSLMGAFFNYCVAYKLGRSFLVKYGKYILFHEKKLSKVETLFNNHGEIITFTGRLLPGVRQYISFPPGIAKMPLLRFITFTCLGAGIWVTVLSLLGYFVGENQELIEVYLHKISWIFIILSILLGGMYILWHKHRVRRVPEG